MPSSECPSVRTTVLVCGKKFLYGSRELSPGGRDVGREVEEAAISQQSGPQLDADDAEDEEDEEAEKQNVAEHRQRVQQQHH